MPKKTMIYVVLIEDRHDDPEIRLFSDKDIAIQYAWDAARQNANRPENVKEEELSDAMVDDGWVFLIHYSTEHDWVTVLERQLDDPTD